MMATDTGEETLRYLVQKYISKPHENDEEEEESNTSTLVKSEEVIDRVNDFLIKNLEDSQKLKIKQ